MHFILPSEAIFSSHCKYWFKMFTLVAALLSQRQFGREVWGRWLAQTGACSGHQFPEQEQVNAQRMPLSLSKKYQPTVYVKSGSSACAQLFWSLGLCMQLFLPEFCVNTKHTEQSFKVTWTQKQLQKIKLAIAEWFCPCQRLLPSPVLALKIKAWANLVLFSTITKWGKKSTQERN